MLFSQFQSSKDQKYYKKSLHRKDLKRKRKTEALYAELNERAEAATISYSATTDYLQYTYSVLVAKNHQKIRSRCLVQKKLKKYSLWLFLFYMAVATYCYYEKVRRTMRIAIVSYFHNKNLMDIFR